MGSGAARILILAAGAYCVEAAPSSVLLENRDGRNAASTGIGRLSLSSNCTAFFIRTPGSGPAYALSAGHCYSLNAQTVFLDRALDGTPRPVLFNFFVDTTNAQVPAPIRRIAYSTMKGSDLLVLELAVTRADLESRGVRPLELEPADPPMGEPVWIVGAPAAFFENSAWFLRSAECTLDQRVDLLEFTWHFRDVRRNGCEDIVGGISGAPVIVQRTGRVAGIVNTTTHLAFNKGGDADCYLGRPCEAGPRGQLVEEETSYSIPVAGLGGCFRDSGEFDVSLGTCPLDRGQQLTVTRRGRNLAPGGRWDATLSGDLPFYRYKTVVPGQGDCRDESGYSSPLSLAERPLITDALPRAETRYLLCVVAGPTAVVDTSWQAVRHATMLIARVDATPPVRPPAYDVFDNGNRYTVAFQFVPPELSGYALKLGPSATTRCDEPGYRPYLRIPVPVPKADGPTRFCFYAEDEAGNSTPALDLEFGAGPVILPGGVIHAAGFVPAGLAPGQWISIYVADPGDAQPRLRDGAGAVHELEVGHRGTGQINARLPVRAALGDGAILLGRREEPVRITPLSPGIFLADTSDGLTLAAYTTGLNGARASELRATIGRLDLPIQSIDPLGGGIEAVRIRLPDGHGLRGRQFLRIRTDQGAESGWRIFTLP